MWKPRAKYKVKNSQKEMYYFTLSPHSVVGRMYNISPRKQGRYFLCTLLLHEPRITSFKYMTNIGGRQYVSFREACCMMGLPVDDAEWMRCLQNAFASTFEPLTNVFATIIALCNPSSLVILWERNVANILADLRKRHAAVP